MTHASPWTYARDAGRLAWRYAAATGPARRRAAWFDEVETYVMFVGYPRSGHSLVGALLDAHPEAAVAHEAAALQHVHARFDRARLFAVLLANAERHGAGVARSARYRYDVPGQWQGRVRRLRVLGDKQGEGASLRLRARPWLLDRLRETVRVPVRVVHGVRNPFDNVATMARRAAEKVGGRPDLDAATVRYAALCETAAAVRRRLGAGAWIDLRHEALVADPAAALRSLCGALGLDAEPGYLAACAGLVRRSPHRSRERVAWTPAQRDAVRRVIHQHPALLGYTFDA